MNRSFHRPYRPADLDSSLIKAFPFTEMAENLMEEASVATSGRASLTLARGNDLTIVLLALKKGSTLADHKAPTAAAVLTLSGSIVFTTSADKITLEQGDGVTFTEDILHSVYANEDSAFLILIGGKHS